MGSMFSKPKAPTPPPVAPVTDANDPATLKARQAAILAAQNRGGRSSTILSNGGDALGSSNGGAR